MSNQAGSFPGQLTNQISCLVSKYPLLGLDQSNAVIWPEFLSLTAWTLGYPQKCVPKQHMEYGNGSTNIHSIEKQNINLLSVRPFVTVVQETKQSLVGTQ